MKKLNEQGAPVIRHKLLLTVFPDHEDWVAVTGTACEDRRRKADKCCLRIDMNDTC